MSKLPKNIQKKGPSYYRIKQGIWVRLGRTLSDALKRNKLIEDTGHENPGRWKYSDIDDHYKTVLRSCKKNSARRDIEFLLTPDNFEALTARANYRCEVSGIPFSLTKVGDTGKRP